MKLFEAELHITVIPGVVLGGRAASPLPRYGSPGDLQASSGPSVSTNSMMSLYKSLLEALPHVMEAQNCQNRWELSKAHPVCAPVHLELPVQLGWAVFLYF